MAGRLLEGAYQRGQEAKDEVKRDVKQGVERGKAKAEDVRDSVRDKPVASANTPYAQRFILG